jgi:hypothetical protein
MGKRSLIFVALVTIGFVLNPVVPVWLFASAVAVLFVAWRILLVRSGPRPLRGASMVHVPAGSEDRSLVCTKGPRPRRIGAQKSTEPLQADFVSIACVPFTPIEITRAELDEDEVRPYGGCTIGDEDPWTKTGDSLSTCEGWPGKKAAEPRGDRGDR